MDDLYDEDIYAWSQHQAAVLRGLVSRPDLPNELDLEHVAEEIEDVGNSQLSAVESYLRLIFVHVLKAASAPESDSVRHWREEAINFAFEVDQRVTKSMRRHIDLDVIWKRALRQAEPSLAAYGQQLRPELPKTCPFDLDELLADQFDVRAAIARLEQNG